MSPRTAFCLAGALCVAGCAHQTDGPVQLAAAQDGDRCTVTADGRPVVFNGDGHDFSQWRGRAVTIRASASLPYRCIGGLVFALQRARTGPITYEVPPQAQEVAAGDDAGRPMTHRAAGSWSGERPSFEARSRRREWRGSTMSNYRSEKSGWPRPSTKAPWAGR